MEIVLQILIGIIVAFHLYVMWLEMFAWTTRGPKVFRNFPKELFPHTKAMAANQGLYNGFLAAGLIWSYFIDQPQWQFHVRLFFLACVFVAGLYGAITADKKIFFVQGLPALLTIVLMHFVPMKCGQGCCVGEGDVSHEIMGYYIGNRSYTSTKILTLEELKRREMRSLKEMNIKQNKDSVIDTIPFEYLHKGHQIVLFTNLPHAPVDGDIVYAKLDNVGTIYTHALTWKNSSYLHTSSDSLNSIISMALSQIIANRTYAALETNNEYDFPPIKPLAFTK